MSVNPPPYDPKNYGPVAGGHIPAEVFPVKSIYYVCEIVYGLHIVVNILLVIREICELKTVKNGYIQNTPLVSARPSNYVIR